MEIMASLPSELGFLAALWLALILETRVPSVLMAAIVVTQWRCLLDGVVTPN